MKVNTPIISHHWPLSYYSMSYFLLSMSFEFIIFYTYRLFYVDFHLLYSFAVTSFIFSFQSIIHILTIVQNLMSALKIVYLFVSINFHTKNFWLVSWITSLPLIRVSCYFYFLILVFFRRYFSSLLFPVNYICIPYHPKSNMCSWNRVSFFLHKFLQKKSSISKLTKKSSHRPFGFMIINYKRFVMLSYHFSFLLNFHGHFKKYMIVFN